MLGQTENKEGRQSLLDCKDDDTRRSEGRQGLKCYLFIIFAVRRILTKL